VTGDSVAQTTVVLPVWDRYVGERLTEALASIEAQDSAALIVLVDNASHVDIPEVPNVYVVRSARRLTLGEARNLGLAQVSTPYVVVWDADDVMLPGTLSFLQAAIDSDRELTAFGSAIVEEPSGRRHRWPRRWIATLARSPRVFALVDAIWSLYPTTGATIMRTDLVHAAQGYAHADSGEDWCLGVSLAFRGRIGWGERPGRIYRVHNESVWARHMTVRHQLQHARAVRDRIRTDQGIPRWARLALPVIQLGQYVAITAHSVVAATRRAESFTAGTRARGR
jgi:glycosyltransferase involved in cell wall biosynthesis